MSTKNVTELPLWAASQRLTWSVRESALACGLSERSLWSAIARGNLPVTRIGGRTLIPDKALREFLGIA
jgi:hypothetical protein